MAILQPDDVWDDEVAGEKHIFGTQCATEVPYPVEMAKLARICMPRLSCAVTLTDDIVI